MVLHLHISWDLLWEIRLNQKHKAVRRKFLHKVTFQYVRLSSAIPKPLICCAFIFFVSLTSYQSQRVCSRWKYLLLSITNTDWLVLSTMVTRGKPTVFTESAMYLLGTIFLHGFIFFFISIKYSFQCSSRLQRKVCSSSFPQNDGCGQLKFSSAKETHSKFIFYSI